MNCISLLDKLNIEYVKDLSLATKSSFRIGGAADIAVFPRTENELAAAVRAVRESGLPLLVVGNGSNILFEDGGYRGAVVFTEKMNETLVCGNSIIAGAGASFTALALTAKNASLCGLEFAYGIPGSVGGAVVMNAGAYGGEVAQVIDSCRVYDAQTDEFLTLSKDEMKLSYRHTVFSENKDLICLSAEFTLKEGNADVIDAKMRELMQRRRDKQPLEYPSAGSVFKRPAPDLFVGKMIEDSGLKGLTVGGARVSEKHAGFIVNIGGATAADVLELISRVQAVIKSNYGVELECEVRRVGDGR
ncbi:MAG: UDP-N-acetylmuramate dehydrogenase [Eubacteriales bacterium]